MNPTSHLKAVRSTTARGARAAVVALLSSLVAVVGCGSASELGAVRGTVAVDGAAVDMGTIQFQPSGDLAGRPAGAAIEDGKFELGPNHGLKPGAYRVVVQASVKTGKTFQDPQRGAVPQLASVNLTDSPQEIDLTDDNAAQLSLTFTSDKKR